MYKEFEKYKTGETVDKEYDIIGGSTPPATVTIKEDQISFGLGDIIHDYIEHRNKPWWKRKYTHSLVLEKYRDMLNLVTITASM